MSSLNIALEKKERRALCWIYLKISSTSERMGVISKYTYCIFTLNNVIK